MCLLHALALCQEALLACDRGRADISEFRFGPHTCEEWVRVYRRIGAIVSLYRAFQQLESRAGPQHIEAFPLGDMRWADFHRFSFPALAQEEFDQMGSSPLGAGIAKMDVIEGPFVVAAEFKHGARRMAAVTSSQDQIIRHGYDLSAWHHLNSPPFPTNLMASVSSSPAAPRELAKQ